MISLKCLKVHDSKRRSGKILDFPHDEECPKMFGISNIVSHIRMESEVAWDDPRPDDVWRADGGPMSVLSIKVVSYVSSNFKVVVKCKVTIRFPFTLRSLESRYVLVLQCNAPKLCLFIAKESQIFKKNLYACSETIYALGSFFFSVFSSKICRSLDRIRICRNYFAVDAV